ncbi:MAG: hypothetical protein L0216_14835 [Planctomycetales bacterium]|nr:hypothetical protein [Planctomycetales bacterium]
MVRTPAIVALTSLALLAEGCAASPRRDEAFLSLDGRGRAAYARERVETSNQVLAAGLTLVAAGLASIAAGWYLTEYDHRARPSPGSLGDRTFPHFWGGVALLAIGVPMATGGAADRIAWGRALDQSRGDPWDGRIAPARPPGETARAAGPRARDAVYVPAGNPLPEGAEEATVIRLGGPADPVVARLAARVPVLRWPVLERSAPDGETDLLVGDDALRAPSDAPGGSQGARAGSRSLPRRLPVTP